jgi:hypothetical protein
VLVIGVVILAVAAAIISGQWLSRRRLRRWCEQQGYDLLDWRGAWFYEGPGKWLRSENQHAYYIEVRDRQGFTRAGYLVFGSYWHPFSRKAEVKWD